MPQPPEWLIELGNEVAARIEPIGGGKLSPIGCHFHHGESGWEITVFASSTEVIGGAHDGRRFDCRFKIDVLALADTLGLVTAINWQAQKTGKHDELGPHLSIEGIYNDEPVWICVPASSPSQFSPGRQIHVYEKVWKEVW